MAQVFNICKNSELPYLTMALNNDGRYDYEKFYYAIQNADVYFTMWNQETGIKKIANAKANVVYDETSGCEERYLIQYRWKKRDTNECGKFIGQFKIIFSDNIKQYDESGNVIQYPSGELLMPIADDLVINVNDNMIKN